MKESKKEKFIRLAEKRVTKALQELRKIGNLAGPTYEYAVEQVKAIITALNDAVAQISIRFDAPCSAENEDFHFVDWIPNGDGEVESADDYENLEGYETTIHTDENA